ncbi:DUF3459 domain-containing protein [Kocuria rhizophila]|nr:DUF3459 domain-containing protein [Kocuria rhizophila]
MDHQEGDPQSTLNLYRRALRVRGELGLGTADFTWHELSDGPEGVLAYVLAREDRTVLVAANLGEGDAEIRSSRAGALLLTSGQDAVIGNRLTIKRGVAETLRS